MKDGTAQDAGDKKVSNTGRNAFLGPENAFLGPENTVRTVFETSPSLLFLLLPSSSFPPLPSPSLTFLLLPSSSFSFPPLPFLRFLLLPSPSPPSSSWLPRDLVVVAPPPLLGNSHSKFSLKASKRNPMMRKIRVGFIGVPVNGGGVRFAFYGELAGTMSQLSRVGRGPTQCLRSIPSGKTSNKKE